MKDIEILLPDFEIEDLIEERNVVRAPIPRSEDFDINVIPAL